MIGSWSSVQAKSRWLFGARRGVGAIAQTIVTKFFLAIVNLGTGMVTARALGAGGRGEQSAMLLWPGLLCYLLTLGMPAAVRYCARREPQRRRELFTVALMVAAVMSAVAATIGVLFIPHWLRHYSGGVVQAAQALMIFAPVIMLAGMFTGMLETLGDFKAANVTRYVPAVITLAALVIMAVAHRMTPVSAALSYLLPPVLTAFWMAWKLRAWIEWHLFDPLPGLRVLGSYGARSYGVDILSTLSLQIDQVLVIGMLSASSLGIYVVGLNASRVLNNLHAAVAIVLFPSASGLEESRVVAMVGGAARVSNGIALVISIVLILCLPVLIPLFYGHPFDNAVHVAQLLTLEALVGGCVYVVSQAFMALDRPGIVSMLQAIGLALAIPLMLVLLPRFGLMGAAIALLLSTSARLAFSLLAFPAILRIAVPSLIPTAADIGVCRAALRRG